MSYVPKKTPARLNKLATPFIPRWVLVLLAVVYIFAGLGFRDAWKTDDAVGLATILSFCNEVPAHSWLTTYIGQYPHVDDGPLLIWIGALFVKLFAPLFELFNRPLQAQIQAVRLANFFYITVLLWCSWHSCRILARRAEAQPLPLPFGGEPHKTEYSRTIADCAFFFIIASIGIVIRMHETSTAPLIIAVNALTFYGLVLFLVYPRRACLVFLLGLSASFFARGVVTYIPLFLCGLICLFYPFYSPKRRRAIALILIFSLLLVALWCWQVHLQNPAWFELWLSNTAEAFGTQVFRQFAQSIRDLLWFTWPAWPFAILALYQWRKWWYAPHIFLPLFLVISHCVLFTVLAEPFELEFAPIIIPIAILASMALPTLRRGVFNTLDWFSIMILSLSMVFIWVAWFAYYTPYIPELHHNIDRLIQGFEASIHWPAVLCAVVITLIWLLLIVWRLHAKPTAIWRGVLLAAVGLTSAWCLLLSLWLPAVNYQRSYVALSADLDRAISRHVAPDQCVSSTGLGDGQRALFYIYKHLQFSDSLFCPWVLVQTTLPKVRDELSPFATLGKTVWQGNRSSERHGEIFQLISLPSLK
ncbi:ArnT family glycosyltransferase [Brackiella oedipodis]|uniref:ArnT family glycosyltransferase n=1 Tax=Brackiella oedipodis TaxID=124225 RepID=UPI00048E9790|nr:hypothetical protein [Brackiella oedipodis]